MRSENYAFSQAAGEFECRDAASTKVRIGSSLFGYLFIEQHFSNRGSGFINSFPDVLGRWLLGGWSEKAKSLKFLGTFSGHAPICRLMQGAKAWVTGQ
jgi:hypothetical protein